MKRTVARSQFSRTARIIVMIFAASSAMMGGEYPDPSVWWREGMPGRFMVLYTVVGMGGFKEIAVDPMQDPKPPNTPHAWI
jgi:hypothetical protein